MPLVQCHAYKLINRVSIHSTGVALPVSNLNPDGSVAFQLPNGHKDYLFDEVDSDIPWNFPGYCLDGVMYDVVIDGC